MPAPEQARPAWSPWITPPVLWVTGPLLLASGAFCTHLWPEWSRNPDLSHGFFAPVVFWLLVVASRQEGTARWLPAHPGVAAAQAAMLLGTLGLGLLAALLAASVGWNHALVDIILAAALAALLLAGLAVLADVRVRLVPFNWASVTACGLWILSAPIPEGTYARLTLHLQTSVTTGVINLLHLLGVPAQQQGNIIVLARTVVGVEEACSGVRSLISCFYVGVFLAAWKVRHPLGRAFLIGLAPVLAIVMNFIRSSALTLMADSGVEIMGFWHDATGFAILGLTTVILAALALWLAPAETAAAPPAPAAPGAARSAPGFRIFAGGAAGIAALALTLAYLSRSAPPVVEDVTPARIAALLPERPAGWESVTPPDLYQFTETLRTEHLIERTYFKLKHGEPLQLNVYIAYWPVGAAPVSLVASHTPDACWPGSGWAAQPNATPRQQLATAAGPLPMAEHRIFQGNRTVRQHVWFWHLYGGRAINYRDPYSVPALLEIALRYGFSRDGSQYFIRITSNQPWEKFADEPLLLEILGQLRPAGLAP